MGQFKGDRYSERNRLLIALVIILSASFVGTSLINYYLTRAAIHREIVQRDLPLTRDNVYSDLSTELMRPILVASSMASDAFLKDWALDGERETVRIIRYLDEIRERYGFFSTFFVSARTGNYYHFKGLHKVVSPTDAHDVWFYDFIEQDREYVLDVDTNEAAHNLLTVFINYKVFDRDGTLLGVTGVGLQVDALARLIGEYQQKYERSIYLTDTNGLIQVHQNKELIEKTSITQMEGIAPLAADILNRGGDTPANYQFRRRGHEILLTVRHIKPIDWLLYVEQSETDALSQARMNFVRTVAIGLAATGFIIFLTLATINHYQHRIEDLATRDSLTGIANRRVINQEFDRFVYASGRSGQPFSAILIDLDGFKQVNDAFGHLAGDLVLKRIADMIVMTVRPTDIVARWGGDEFVVLTALAAGEAKAIAERVRGCVAAASFADPDPHRDDPRDRLTLSCGVAQFLPGDDLDKLLARADQAMYGCKEKGGDGVLLFDA